MEPFRYRKKLVKIGNGKYVLMPASWVEENFTDDEQEVIVEIQGKEIKIIPLKKK